MSMRHEPSFLKDILTACRKIEAIVAATNERSFLKDEVLPAAVLHHLTVIGEAITRLSVELRERHPEVPWRQIIAVRHRIVHAYFDLDWQILWDAAIRSSPSEPPPPNCHVDQTCRNRAGGLETHRLGRTAYGLPVVGVATKCNRRILGTTVRYLRMNACVTRPPILWETKVNSPWRSTPPVVRTRRMLSATSTYRSKPYPSNCGLGLCDG